MSTQLRNVPGMVAQFELTQTRFWGGKDRMQCIQVTQRKPQHTQPGPADQFFNSLQLTKHQARQLAVELMLFAEDREVTEFEDCGGDDHHAVEVNADTMAHLANSN